MARFVWDFEILALGAPYWGKLRSPSKSGLLAALFKLRSPCAYITAFGPTRTPRVGPENQSFDSG